MKRALAVCTVLAALGFSAFGIGTFAGKWEAEVKLLPSPPALTKNKLTIEYTDLGWTFGAVLDMIGRTPPDYDTLDLTAKGAFGPLSVDAVMNFDFEPKYLGAKLTTKLDFAGISLSFVAAHGAAYVTDVGCQTPAQSLKYEITAKVPPVTAKLTFRDCCTGTEFYSAKLTVEDIPICCGISLDSELSFLKTGFEYLKFTGIEIPICCGVSLTAGVEFGVDYKMVETGLKLAPIGDVCFTVYADAQPKYKIPEDPESPVIGWAGIDIYGWKIKCAIAECNYIEILTALKVTEVEAIVGDIFTGDEFEYVKLGFCGPGCCGGQYEVGISVYFVEEGSLFGINRIGATMSIPIMANFTVKVDFSTPAALKVGWVFTF